MFLLNNQGADAHQPAAAAPSRAENLDRINHLATALLREVEAINKTQTVEVNQTLSFYDQVERFETDLIRRALERTGGHQTRASRLLGIKLTTLNHKIKRYDIKILS